MEPIDIVMLTYNRLDYLVTTVTTLRERTPEPFRLTVVDNASNSDVRNWLAENRDLFHQVILQAGNEHIAGFQRGIDATTSDPFLLAEPDLIVPELRPSWLAQLRGLFERHPEFGLVALGLDTANRPSTLGSEVMADNPAGGGEIVEENVGIWFQMIRRDALRIPYEKDSAVCAAVREAGYRVGWTPHIRAVHLGWDDHRQHPAHLASKNELPSPYPQYKEVELVARPPALVEIAQAAPIVAEIRDAGVADEAVLELAWGEPVIAPAIAGTTTLRSPWLPVPLPDRSAGATVIVEPPVELAERVLAEAERLSTSMVVVVAALGTFGGRSARDLAPSGWSGRERSGAGSITLELARGGDELAAMQTHLRYTTLEHQDEWLAFFAAGSIPPGTDRRVFVFTPVNPAPAPPTVVGAENLQLWLPPPRSALRPQDSLRWRARHRVATRTPARLRRFFRVLSGGRADAPG
jgi:hypothetical protein